MYRGGEEVSMEQMWNETDRETSNLSQCHFVEHKSPFTGLELYPGLRGGRQKL